ncbi:unnamed protein product [Lota lota]
MLAFAARECGRIRNEAAAIHATMRRGSLTSAPGAPSRGLALGERVPPPRKDTLHMDGATGQIPCHLRWGNQPTEPQPGRSQVRPSSPTGPSTRPPHSPAGSETQTQSALLDGIIKAGSFIQHASEDQLETRDSGHSACSVGEPHPGQAIVARSP